jgi:hypothetical protein
VAARAVAAVVLVAVVIPAPVIVEGAVVIAPVAGRWPSVGCRCGEGGEPGVIVAAREPLRETNAAFAHRIVVQLIGSDLVPLIRFPSLWSPARKPLCQLNRLASVLVYRFEACRPVLIPGRPGIPRSVQGPQAACTC